MKKEANQRSTWQLQEFNKPLLIAAHFGFLPISAPKTSDEDIEMTSDCGSDPHYRASEKAAFLRAYTERDFSSLPHPLGVTYKRGKNYSLELVGFPEGLAEAILIRTSLSVLLETGHKHLVVDINCIGDKESISSYEKELQTYLRQSGANLPPELKKELKQDIFNLIKLRSKETEDLRQSAPTSIAFLSAESRAYFKEVLEYIEALDIEFRLAPELVGDKNYCSHTIFNIKNSKDDEEVLAVGYSYHQLGKRFGIKKETTLAGTTIFTDPKTKAAKKVYKTMPRPKFYLIQLGRSAKMKTLSTIELLRRERIAVHHVLGKDKLNTQLSNAESLQVPYLLIIGQKEALEDAVTVRNVNTRAQETVPVEKLVKFLKKLPI